MNPLRCKQCFFIGKNGQSLGAHVRAKHGNSLARSAKHDDIEQDVRGYLATGAMRLITSRDEIASQIATLQDKQAAVIAELARVNKAQEAYEAELPLPEMPIRVPNNRVINASE